MKKSIFYFIFKRLFFHKKAKKKRKKIKKVEFLIKMRRIRANSVGYKPTFKLIFTFGLSNFKPLNARLGNEKR